MAKNGQYMFFYTYVQENDAGAKILESGKSPTYGPVTVTDNIDINGVYTSQSRITHVYLYSTLAGGGVFYREKRFANVSGSGTWTKNCSMEDDTLRTQAQAYNTNKGYETKRLYVSGVLPALAFVTEGAGRLWGCGRFIRTGTNEDATLHWSEFAPNWNDWPVANTNTKFAQRLTGLYEWNEMIYPFTRNSRWRVIPAAYNDGMQFHKLEGGVGCIGGHTITKIGQAIMWLGQDGFYISMGDEQPFLVSSDISSTIRSINKDRAWFAVGNFYPELQFYRCWVTEGTDRLNNLLITADLSRGIENIRWSVGGGFGRTVYSLGAGVVSGGQYRHFAGDHLGNVFQENLGNSDGANEGGTYQGLLSHCTTSSTTTTTTTTSSTTTTTSTTTTSTTT